MGSDWRGRVFLGSGDMLYAGPIAPTELHAHHAFQLVVARVGSIRLRSTDGELECRVAVVPSDERHAIVSGHPSTLMLYVDPEGADGRRLRASAPTGIGNTSASWQRSDPADARLQSLDLPVTWTDAEATRAAMLELVVGSAVRPKPRHPALVRAMRWLADRLDGSLRIAAVAHEVGLSEGRLAHLFADELGLPFRAYVAWLRMRRAAAALQAGESIASAAQHGGFADAAHFTRTFKRMFGIVPSEIAGVVDWIAEPSAIAT